MNQGNMLKWIEALESGDYAQCSGKLTKVYEDGTKSHCCLGVATELAIADGVGIVSTVEKSDGVQFICYSWPDEEDTAYETNWLPSPVAKWLGVESERNYLNLELVGSDGTTVQASTANDQIGWSFQTIAASLRRKYNLPK